jgi:hypothetical protein
MTNRVHTGLIERVVTVTGPAITKPGNYLIPLGTPLRWALEQAGCTDQAASVVLGGPMMGASIGSFDIPLTKGVTGVLVEPQLPSLLADALASVITDPARRQTLAQAGQTRMARDFGMQSNLARLAVKFGLRVPPGYVSSGP